MEKEYGNNPQEYEDLIVRFVDITTRQFYES